MSAADVTHATFDGALVTVHTKTREILTDDSLQDLEANEDRFLEYMEVEAFEVIKGSS